MNFNQTYNDIMFSMVIVIIHQPKKRLVEKMGKVFYLKFLIRDIIAFS